MGNRLSRHIPQLLRCRFGLVRTLLDLRVRPLEVEGQVEIGSITALRDDVADEGAMRAGASEVDLKSWENWV